MSVICVYDLEKKQMCHIALIALRCTKTCPLVIPECIRLGGWNLLLMNICSFVMVGYANSLWFKQMNVKHHYAAFLSFCVFSSPLSLSFQM